MIHSGFVPRRIANKHRLNFTARSPPRLPQAYSEAPFAAESVFRPIAVQGLLAMSRHRVATNHAGCFERSPQDVKRSRKHFRMCVMAVENLFLPRQMDVDAVTLPFRESYLQCRAQLIQPCAPAQIRRVRISNLRHLRNLWMESSLRTQPARRRSVGAKLFTELPQLGKHVVCPFEAPPRVLSQTAQAEIIQCRLDLAIEL